MSTNGIIARATGVGTFEGHGRSGIYRASFTWRRESEHGC